MKKIWLIWTLILLFTLTAAACGTPGADSETEAAAEETASSPMPDSVSVMALKGPTGMGMAYMMDNCDYDFQVVGAPDEVVAALSSGQADIAAVPTNLAAKLYAKTSGDLVLLAIDTYGTLYLCVNGEDVNSLQDLEGKQVCLAGQGANPQYVLEYLLAQADVHAELVYCTEHTEAATRLAAGEIDCALLPEPNLTAALMKSSESENVSLRVALDCNQLWQEACGQELCLGCVVASRDFVQQYPEFVRLFLQQLKESIDYANNDHSGAAALCEAYGIVPSAELAELAIPTCSLCFVSGKDMQAPLTSFYEVLLAADPASVGGALPGDDFYYAAE